MTEFQPAGGAGHSGKKPGATLRAAREARGLSVEEVSAALHLSPKLIDAIERDDYDALPIATYVRGYLRAYCRQVDIDADPVIQAFEQAVGEIEEPALEPVTHGQAGVRRYSLPVAIVVLLAVALFGTVAWWFHGRGEVPTTEAESVADPDMPELDDPAPAGGDGDADAAFEAVDEPVEESIRDATESEPETVAEEPTFEPADEDAQLGNGDAEPTVEAEPAVPEPVDPEPVLAALAATSVAAQTDDDDPNEDVGAAEQAELPRATATADEATTDAAAIGPDGLRLVVEGESWLEIHDRMDRQLVYTLYSGEEPLELRGWAPFDVFLGNSPDVRVYLDGEAVTKDEFTRSNDTARFIVDRDGAHVRPPQDAD